MTAISGVSRESAAGVTQIAESLAAAGHAERARPYLDVLAAEPAGSPAPERLAYLEGRWHEAADEADAALARYDSAAAGDDRAWRFFFASALSFRPPLPPLTGPASMS